MEQIITIELIKTIYRKEDNGWGIYKTNQGIAKGTIAWNPKAGQTIKLKGKFQSSDFNGQQEFVFKEAYPTIPDESRSLLSYAVSITKGLGSKKEEDIWEKYGESWQEQEELEISGTNKNVNWHWKDTLTRIKTEQLQSNTFGWLLSKGASMNMAVQAWKKWKEQAYGVINDNPYALADLPNYGFADVDKKIRKEFNIGDTDYRRIDSAIIYILKNQITDGSTWVMWEDIEEHLTALIQEAKDYMEQSLERLIIKEKIVQTNNSENKIGFSLFDDAEAEQKIFKYFLF